MFGQKSKQPIACFTVGIKYSFQSFNFIKRNRSKKAKLIEKQFYQITTVNKQNMYPKKRIKFKLKVISGGIVFD